MDLCKGWDTFLTNVVFLHLRKLLKGHQFRFILNKKIDLVYGK